MRLPRRPPATLALLAALVTLAAPAPAVDTWTRPEAGLRHLHRTASGPLELDALLVDLCDPSLELAATRSDERGQTPGAWARSVGARAAINADFFNYTGYVPIGLAVGRGQRWTDTADDGAEAVFAWGTSGRVEIRDGAEVLAGPEPWMMDVASGRPNCLVAGVPRFHTDIHFDELHPRTAVGLSADRRTLFLLVIDGRSSRSIGVTTQGVGHLLLDLGARDGLNFDGGGSTAMWLAAEGVVNHPSDGAERVVANHLGVLRVAVPEGEPSRCCDPAPVPGSDGPFGDVPAGHFARAAIDALEPYVSGCSASPRLFCPGCRTTRGAGVAMLVRALRRSLPRPATPHFTDVPTTHPLYAEIERALADGLTTGCGGGRFCPDDPLPRSALALFVARAIGAPTGMPPGARFDDLPATDPAAGAVSSLVELCIVSGCTSTRFCPARTATRAESAVVIARAAGLVATPCAMTDAGTPRDAVVPDGPRPPDVGWDTGTVPIEDSGAPPETGADVTSDPGTTDAAPVTDGPVDDVPHAADPTGCACRVPCRPAGALPTSPGLLLVAMGVGACRRRRDQGSGKR